MQSAGHTVADLVELQNLLHEVITAFASGAVLQANRFLPGSRMQRLHPAWESRFDRLKTLSAQAGNRVAAKKEACAYHNAANILACAYQVLDVWIGKQDSGSGGLKPVCRRALSGADKLPGSQAVLNGLRDYWAPDFDIVLAGAYVHGSYSTEDITGYSDLDTLLILRRTVAVNGDALYRFGRRAMKSFRYLLQADLLQHHANFILTEIDLDYYCDAYFPGVLFGHATSLFQAEALEISRTRDSGEEARSHLLGMCQRFDENWEHRHLTVAYHLKLQLSCFMILPAVLLEVLGRSCYKQESFRLAKSLFPPALWSIMDEVSELRTRWHQVDSPVLKRLVWYRPFLWNQIAARGGRMGVPENIWKTVQDTDFRKRMGAFARHCMVVAETEGKA